MLAATPAAYAQTDLSRYYKNLLYEADIYFVQGDYYYASELYTELAAEAPESGEIAGKLGACYFHLPTLKGQSMEHLNRAAELGDTEALYYLAQLSMEDYRFYDALSLLGQYESSARRQRSAAEIGHLKAVASRAIDMVKTPAAVQVINMGDQINSDVHDYAPVLDANSGKVYFTSRRRYDDSSEKDISDQYDENIFVIDLTRQPLKAAGAGEPLNSRSNDAAVACSPGGTALIMFRTRKDGLSGDLYLTRRQAYSWSELEALDDEINSKYHEASAAFGDSEETILYFSSDRPDGFGGKDLYKSTLLPDGSWSQAQNLGAEINTPFDEDAPFISSDGALYFASKGHATMGGYDIFCSAPTAAGELQKPRNMGYPINTPGDDIFFVMDGTGQTAFFSSERLGGMGLQDIYKIEFNQANTLIYRGEVVAGDHLLGQEANITLVNEENGQVEGLYQTDPKTGEFVLALQANRKYTVMVESKGYQTLEKALILEEPEGNTSEIRTTLSLAK